MNAPLGMWIHNALENGGTFRIRKRKGRYGATMFWPTFLASEPITKQSKTLEGALRDLNESLQEDAAQEMLNNPNSGV